MHKVLHDIKILGIATGVLLIFPAAVTAVTFTGNIQVLQNLSVGGTISKGSGTFVIDHPLDPANKTLTHSFVESPDVMNMYDGTATLGEDGSVVITLPDYFEALNMDFTYQYTALGEPAPGLYIQEEIEGNQFTIAGGPAGAAVSWQVTGVRHDPYIEANPIEVEVEKGPDTLINTGEYLFEGYNTETNTNQ